MSSKVIIFFEGLFPLATRFHPENRPPPPRKQPAESGGLTGIAMSDGSTGPEADAKDALKRSIPDIGGRNPPKRLIGRCLKHAKGKRQDPLPASLRMNKEGVLR